MEPSALARTVPCSVFQNAVLKGPHRQSWLQIGSCKAESASLAVQALQLPVHPVRDCVLSCPSQVVLEAAAGRGDGMREDFSFSLVIST